MLKVLFIGLGGAAGSILRYLVAGWVQTAYGAVFPLGTLVVNVAGCLAIGFLATLFAGPVLVRDEYRMLILVGLLGGFTTFSTFSWETHNLAADGQFIGAGLNILLSTALGLVAAWLGHRACLLIFGV